MRVIYLFIIALMLFAAGCVKPPEDTGGSVSANGNGHGKPQRAPEYRFPLPADPLTLDPAHITDTVSDTVSRRIFNNLVKFDVDGSVTADLAEEWNVSDDGLVYDFKIREGVEFHNGDPLTAKDIAYSLNRLVDPATHSERANLLYFVKGARDRFDGETEEVAGIEVVDDHNLRLTLTDPYAPFLNVLCMSNFGVVPRSVVDPDPDGFSAHPVGTGPFVFSEWARGEKIVLKSNPSYFVRKPWLERVIFLVIEDEKTRFENFKNGAIDHCDIPPSQIQEVRNDPALSKLIFGEPAMDRYCYGFNCEQPPFKDNSTLRRALNHAIDKQNIIDTIWGGLVSLQNTYVPAGMFYFWEDAPGYEYDMDRAIELLAEAGYPEGDGLDELVLNIDIQATNKLVAQAIQEDLRKIGVRVRIEVTEWGSFLPKVYAGESLFFQNTWLGDYPDPDTWLYQLLHSDNFGDAGNITRWANSEFDHLVGLAQVEMSQQVRSDLYRQAEQIAYDEAPWLLLFWKNSATLVQPHIEGLVITQMDRTPQLNNAPLENVTFKDE